MRHVFAALGCIAALIMLCVSAAMNWQYGFNLGKTPFDSHILGAASIAADCLKALLPFFIFAAWRHRNWSQAIGGSALWMVCILYALASAIGFASLNRSDTTATRAVQAQQYQDLRAQLDQVSEQRKWLQEHRSVGMVEAEIDAAKQNFRWTSSEGCTNATVTLSREFCEAFHKLQAELAAAKTSEILQAQATEVRQKLSNIDASTVTTVADPQATMIAIISGVDIKKVELGLTILVTLLVELGSSMGLYVSTSTWRVHEQFRRPAQEQTKVVEIVEPRPVGMQIHAPPQQEAPLALPRSDIQNYFNDRIREDDGSSITALSLYDNYCEWCERSERQPVGLPIFSRQLTDLGVQKAKIAGKIRYIGIRVHEADEEDGGSNIAAVS
ncbi:MAG: hypothetical protein KTR19_06840 [Hyphomicrobiales bacterium]|nr:hypothetical protein [Hyphomicrobiales bacterium]